MNDYLSGIMALAQMTPEQFDLGMQRFQQIQGMQPQGLSALQARQSGLTANMAGGQSQLGQLPQNYTTELTKKPRPSGPEIPAGFTSTMSTGNSSYYHNPQTGESFTMFHPLNGAPASMSEIRPAPEGFEPPPAQPMNERQQRFAELQAGQPTMTPTQGLEGGFGTGPTPYRQPYYQSSFVNRNPYFSGYGMGYNSYMPQFGRVGTYGSPGKGGGYGGGYGGGFGSYGKGGGI
jgi:hypothetical protein